MMTDKVQKIREDVERLKESGCASPIVICDTLLAFIDSLQEEPVKIKKGCKYLCLGDMFNNDTGKISFIGGKIYLAPEDNTLVSEENGWRCDTSENASNFELVEEPISIWHDASEKPERDDLLIETNDGRLIHRKSINNYGMVKRWAYASDLLNLDNSCNFGKNLQEELKDKCNGCNNVKGCITCVDGSEWAHLKEASKNYADKEKFRKEVEKLKSNLIYGACSSQIAMETTCKEEAFNEVLAILDTMQEEPVSEELAKAAKENAKIERSDDTEVGYDINRFGGFVDGANWQKTHLWKPADGDDLPKIDREVIALIRLDGFFQLPPDEPVELTYKVVFAHRPNPDGWDGKSLTTGNVEHYTPKTYGEGGWNIPDIVYWLDVELPKEIEL